MQKPLDMQQLVSQVNSPESAIEVYAASLVAIDETRAEGRTYMRSLALALDLPNDLVAAVHDQVSNARRESVAA